MVWDVSELERRFFNAQNAETLSFLAKESPSAHSDLTEELVKSAEGLPDLNWFCPDVHSYAYVLVHTEQNAIFGIALGMKGIVFKLPEDQIQSAQMEGGLNLILGKFENDSLHAQ